MTFEELKKIKNPGDYPFTRTQEVKARYEKHLNILRMAGITPAEHILEQNYLPLTPNEYPYDWEDCQHMVLWGDYSDEELNSLFGGDDNIVWFKNNPNNQSVKGLPHVQVITPRDYKISFTN